MKDEYIIINKTAILKRIEELKPISEYNERVGEYDSEGEIISELEYILSQSIPLIPEIQKALETGREDTIEYEDYISNLKLDI